MKLKKLTLITLMAMASQAANASSNAIPIGPNIGYGDASNKSTIFSTIMNPAWISNNVQEENNYGLGLSATIRIKQNALNKLFTDYENNVQPLLEGFNSSSSDALTKAEDIKQKLNALLLDTRDDFYAQQDVAVSVPMAITHGSWGGLGLEVSGNVIGREKLLTSNTPIDINASYLISNPNATTDQLISNGLTIQSALYLKTAVYQEGALTYGNQFYENDKGRLSVGLRAKFMQAKLVKSINNLDKYLTSTSQGGSVSDQIQKDFDKHTDLSSFDNAFGVDIGATWFADNWMAGASIQNVNTPTFKFNTLGVGTTTQAYVDKFYSNQVNLAETVKLEPQGRIEGAVYSKNRHWTLAASYDTNEVTDLVGQPYQWATISASYATDFAFSANKWYYALIPDVRIGYRSNRAGDERSYYTPGLTWGPVNLDLAFENFDDISKAVSGDKNDLPAGFMASLGLEFYF